MTNAIGHCPRIMIILIRKMMCWTGGWNGSPDFWANPNSLIQRAILVRFTSYPNMIPLCILHHLTNYSNVVNLTAFSTSGFVSPGRLEKKLRTWLIHPVIWFTQFYFGVQTKKKQWWEKNSHPVDMTLGEVIMVMNDLDTEMSVYPTTVVDPNLIKKSRVSKLRNTQKIA
jgi:hypothetical protein